jgi:transcription initiation factor TFIIB
MVYYTPPKRAHIQKSDIVSKNEIDDEIKTRREDGEYRYWRQHSPNVSQAKSGEEGAQISPLTCSICKSSNTVISDPESGELVCSNCGVVISDKIHETNRPEWRAFNREEENTRIRTGAPTSLTRHDMGLATVIGKTDIDASGHKIDASLHSTMGRLRKWDLRTQTRSSTDRSLLQAFSELNILKDKLGLPDAVVEKTAYIYRKAQERGFVRGKSISAVISASIYVACREMGVSKTIKDIAAVSNIRNKTLARIYRQLILELDFRVSMTDPVKCIAKVANKANLSEKTARQAISVMNDLNSREISVGKNPMSLAATVLYISCIKTGESIRQDDISRAAGVTGVTLRNRLKDIKNHLV